MGLHPYDGAMVDVPASLNEIAKRVDARIDETLTAEIERWSGLAASLTEPLEVLRQLVLAGGKRLRPAFCHWAFVGAGGDPDDPCVVDAGAALELLHMFALVHDDVMDGSSTRARHRRPSISPSSSAARPSAGVARARRFGEGVAILVGDLAFVYADMLLAGAPAAALGVFTELRLEVNIGQYLDLLGTVRRRRDARDRPPRSAGTSRASTPSSGRCTWAQRSPAGSTTCARPSRRTAMPLGEAFQLRDDLLGAFGDTERHRQAGRRGSARGQADAAARARHQPRPPAPPPRFLRDRFGDGRPHR